MAAPRPAAVCPLASFPPDNWTDRRCLLVLLLVTLLIRGIQLVNTEVTSRDSVSYIQQAWALLHQPFLETLRKAAHHPGYPLAIAGLSIPVRWLLPNDLPLALQLTSQLVSALASLLLVFPAYFLGRDLFSRAVAFWSTLLLELLPSTGVWMSDGLSEGLFLLLACAALFCAVRAIQGGRLGWFAAAGFLIGLAYLTRTEGLLIVLVMLPLLLGLQWFGRLGRTWRQTTAAAVVLVATCAVVAAPFMVLIGGISLKASARYMSDPEGWKLPARKAAALVDSPLPVATWWIGPDVEASDRYGWAAWAVLSMMDKGFFHLLGPFVALGLIAFYPRTREKPGLWLLYLVGLLLVPLLYKLAQTNGYVGQRHVLLLILCGIYFGVAAIGLLARILTWHRPTWTGSLALVLLLGIVTICVPRTLARLHGNREGFREAGIWLAQNTLPGDPVIDPFTWTYYFSGRLFVSESDQPARSHPGVCYVVLEKSLSKHDHLYHVIDPAKKLAAAGQLVYHKHAGKGKTRSEVFIYRVPQSVQTAIR